MNWFQTILQRLRQILIVRKKWPKREVGSSVEKHEHDTPQLKVRTDTYKFENLDQLVKPLLEKMGEDRWGRGFSYEAENKQFKWSIWKPDRNSEISEYWIVKFIPESAQFKIRANNTTIESSLSMIELKAALAKAVEVGPDRMSISYTVNKDIFWDDIR